MVDYVVGMRHEMHHQSLPFTRQSVQEELRIETVDPRSTTDHRELF